MRHEHLQGWNIDLKTTEITVAGENGQPVLADGWRMTLEEVIPPSGNKIIFDFGKGVRDYIVRELTGGIVLHGGDLPRL